MEPCSAPYLILRGRMGLGVEAVCTFWASRGVTWCVSHGAWVETRDTREGPAPEGMVLCPGVRVGWMLR